MLYNFNQKLSTEKFTIEIDTAANYGYFEHNTLGDECGGGLWLGHDDDAPGQVALLDYDGTWELPKQVAAALRGAGYYVGTEFD